MGGGALVYGRAARSAAEAGAAKPSATSPTVPSKNFFIVFSPAFVASLDPEAFLNSNATARAIQFLRAIYPIRPEMPSPKCNTWQRSEAPEVNDLLRVFREPD